MAGWGTTTLISSGKDVYIHYAAPEFAFALANDARTKAAVLYAEPGGYYELDANFTKPVVACVVGRWKSKLTRAVGHAGAMAGGNDDAEAKEQWFMAKFGVDDIFTPENPVFSPRGAVVTNIAHIPQALTAVMQANAARPDFEPEGSLALKPWFGSSQGIVLPPELDLPVVAAASPYDKQIEHLNRQIGAVFPRQAMKDASGASQMDRQDPDHVPPWHVDAGRGAVPGGVEHLPVAAERTRQRERPEADQCRRGGGDQPVRHAGSRCGPGGAGGRQCSQHGSRRSVQHPGAAACGPGTPSRAGTRGRLYGSGIAERPRRGVRSRSGATSMAPQTCSCPISPTRRPKPC